MAPSKAVAAAQLLLVAGIVLCVGASLGPLFRDGLLERTGTGVVDPLAASSSKLAAEATATLAYVVGATCVLVAGVIYWLRRGHGAGYACDLRGKCVAT